MRFLFLSLLLMFAFKQASAQSGVKIDYTLLLVL